MKRSVTSSLLASFLIASTAFGLEWPDASERTERASFSSDSGARVMAARSAVRLGPERAAPLLVRLLADSDPAVRAAAAQSATALKLKSALDTLPTWLSERSVDVRLVACQSMKALPDPRWVPALSRALNDAEIRVRVEAADALGHQGVAEAVPPLLGKLDDAAPQVRENVIRALVRLRDPRAVIALVGKTQDSSAEVRQAAARALGTLADARATMALVQLTRDPNNEVRAAAARALRPLQAPESVDALVLAARDRETAVRHAAIDALGGISTDEAVSALITLLGTQDDRSTNQGETVVRKALVQQGTRGTHQLLALLKNGGPAAEGAAWVLGRLAIADAVLIDALRSGHLAPGIVLPALKASDSLSVALEYLGTETADLRRAAREAVLRILPANAPDGRVVAPVAQVLKTAPTGERGQLIEILGRSRTASAAPYVVEQLRNSTTLLASIDALGTLHSDEGDRALVGLLSASESQTRSHAAAALFRGGGDVARALLPGVLADNSHSVDRKAAMIALLGSFARSPKDADALRALLPQEAPAERGMVVQALASAGIDGSRNVTERALFARGLALQLFYARRPEETKKQLLALLRDREESVQAEAAWSLGLVHDATLTPALLELAKRRGNAAVNASAALARTGDASQLCALLENREVWVQTNALVGLAMRDARCGTGDRERSLLTHTSKGVRLAAAMAIAHKSLGADDTRALAQCSTEETDAEVQSACLQKPMPRSKSMGHAPTLTFIANERGPSPHTAFTARFSSGIIRTGLTDGMGAVLDLLEGGETFELLAGE